MPCRPAFHLPGVEGLSPDIGGAVAAIYPQLHTIRHDCASAAIVRLRAHAYSAQPPCSCAESCVMRCMMCGDNMVLTDATPAETGGVQGFETQTHQCPACHGTERRFIFVGTKTEFGTRAAKSATLACADPIKIKVPHDLNGADKTPVHSPSSIKFFADSATEKCGARSDKLTARSSAPETTLLASEPPLVENVTALNAGDPPGQAWARAVEKFRRYEADLHERVEKTKKTNPNIEATKGSGLITVPARLQNKSHDALAGERLPSRARYAVPIEKPEVDHEALRRFDEFWENGMRPHNAQRAPEPSVAPASIYRFPRSVSEVAIEPKTGPDNNMRGKRVFKKMLEKVLQCLEP